MKKNILVLDFETTSTDPDTCDVIQIGAKVIDGARLKFIDDSVFYQWCCPDNANDADYYDKNKKTLDWHANNYKISAEVLMKKIKESPSEKQVMQNFVEYFKKYHAKATGQTIYSAPMIAAFNGFAFDFPILDRLARKYGYVDKNNKPNLYFTRDSIDIMKVAVMWMMHLNDITSYSMDSLREYMEMPHTQSHDAKDDVDQEGELLIRFMKLMKNIAPTVKFKGCFAKKEHSYA